MVLRELLCQKKAKIIKIWSQAILETYPSDTQKFLKTSKNRFSNPVGYTISRVTETLYDGLLEGMGREAAASMLDDIIRIRAIQDFSPSQAVSFLFELKKAIRGELHAERRNEEIYRELLSFESRIDEMALLGFDLYMKRRERLYEITANELRQKSMRLLDRINRFYEKKGQTLDLHESNNE